MGIRFFLSNECPHSGMVTGSDMISKLLLSIPSEMGHNMVSSKFQSLFVAFYAITTSTFGFLFQGQRTDAGFRYSLLQSLTNLLNRQPPISPTPRPIAPTIKDRPELFLSYFFLDIFLSKSLVIKNLYLINSLKVEKQTLSFQILTVRTEIKDQNDNQNFNKIFIYPRQEHNADQQKLERFFAVFFSNSLLYQYLYKDMTYRPNFGNPYTNYNPENSLGYSNASKNFNKYSFRNGNQEQGAIGEVEFMLQNERKKFRQVRERIQADLDNQRKRRIEFENKLIRLKDEFSRKEVALSEAQFKINNLLHQNQDLALQNDKLKHQLSRLQQLYGGKIHELQAQLNMETKNFEQTTLQYNEEFNKFKKQGQQYVQSLNFEFQRKIKNLQEKLKSTEIARRDLAMQNKKLNDLLISNRMQFEEQMRDVKNKSRDEEIKKAQYLTKSFEAKLRNVQDSKEGLNRKIQELIRMIQDKESKLAELERDLGDQNSKLRQEKADSMQQINQLNYLLSKARNQLAEKDNMIGRSMSGSDSELKMLRQQLEAKKQQIAQLQASLRDTRLALKDLQTDSQRKRRELVDRCTSLEAEARRYKEEYARLAEMLKTKINSTIDNVSLPRK